MKKTFIFTATKGKATDCLLYKTFGDTAFYKENNTTSLQKVYNKAIDFALEENFEYLVLVHDDVILENYSQWRLEENFKKYDIIGVAGTTEVKLQPPALWHLMGGGFNGGNLRGAVAHLNQNKKFMTSFGEYPSRVVLLDGVFLAMKRSVFEKVRFDESCPSNWHFYDLDYTMQSHKEGFKNGVGDIIVTHASPGLREFTDEFNKGQEWFLNKWSPKKED